MSDTRSPTRACSIPRYSASSVTRSSSAASSEIAPTGTVIAASP